MTYDAGDYFSLPIILTTSHYIHCLVQNSIGRCQRAPISSIPLLGSIYVRRNWIMMQWRGFKRETKERIQICICLPHIFGSRFLPHIDDDREAAYLINYQVGFSAIFDYVGLVLSKARINIIMVHILLGPFFLTR